MKIKPKRNLFLVITLIFFIIISFTYLGYNSIKSFLSSNLDISTKNTIKKILKKKDLFFLSNYEKDRYKFLEKDRVIYTNIVKKIKKEITLQKVITKKISNDFFKNINIYYLPFENYKNSGKKPVGFFFKIKGKLYLITGDAFFYEIKINKQITNKLELVKIDSNINFNINSEIITNKGQSSIKGVMVDSSEENIYISTTNLKTNDCYNLKIIKANLIENFFKVQNFFEFNECVKKKKDKRFSILQGAGGNMIDYNNKILFSTGDYANYSSAQNLNDPFGKVLLIDKIKKETEIISAGHRNIQGMYLDRTNNTIIYSEMGPKGGDEININKKPFNGIVKNYGWPISSYGDHYDNKFLDEAPLYNSHKKFGFIEPIKFWNPSIAPTKIQKIYTNEGKENIYVLSTLGYLDQIKEGDQSLHFLYFNKDYSMIRKIKQEPIYERVRDFLIDENYIYLMLESLPGIGIAKLK